MRSLRHILETVVVICALFVGLQAMKAKPILAYDGVGGIPSNCRDCLRCAQHLCSEHTRGCGGLSDACEFINQAGNDCTFAGGNNCTGLLCSWDDCQSCP